MCNQRTDLIKIRSNCFWQMTITLSTTVNGNDKRFRNCEFDSNNFSALTEFALKHFHTRGSKHTLRSFYRTCRGAFFFGRNFYIFIFRLIRSDVYRARATIQTIIILQLHFGRSRRVRVAVTENRSVVVGNVGDGMNGKRTEQRRRS